MSRVRTLLDARRKAPLCGPVPLVNGYGRKECGLLFYSPSGRHGPARFAQINVGGIAHFEFVAGSINGVTNDVFNAATFSNTGGVRNPGYAELRILPVGVLPASGYIQIVQAWSATGRPGVALIALNGGRVQIGVEADHATLGQENVELNAAGAGLVRNAIPGSGSPVNIALEVRPGDSFCQGWSDPGGDPRNLFLGGAGITSLSGPCYVALIMQNNQNGFQENAAWGDIVVCKRRDVQFAGGPPNGSVRISVNGVVQTFPGPVSYFNLDGAGGGRWVAAPGVWWPSLVRYEVFSAAALGGVLVTDLTVPTSWGGDVIGPV